MDFTPDEAARRRVAEHVKAAMERTSDPFQTWKYSVEQLPDGVLAGLLAGTDWPAPDYRKKIEGAFYWREGDLEWIARGGEPTVFGDSDDRRRWVVRVVVERTVEAPNDQDALVEVTEPLRAAYGGGEVGVVECSATNVAFLKRERALKEDR